MPPSQRLWLAVLPCYALNICTQPSAELPDRTMLVAGGILVHIYLSLLEFPNQILGLPVLRW